MDVLDHLSTSAVKPEGRLPLANQSRSAFLISSCQVRYGIALVFLAGACGGHVDPSVAPALQQRELTVEVRNHNFYDATIYAWDSGERLRLGMAQGKSTTTFSFRWDLGDLRFIIDFIGAGELVGEVLAVDPGDDLVLIVGSEDHRRANRSGHDRSDQETMILEGRILDSRTAQPLPDVKVTLLNTGVETRTSKWGVYRLVSDTATEVNVRLLLPDYATAIERVVLNDNRTIIDFKMTRVDAVLDALLITEQRPDVIESEGGFAVRSTELEDVLSSNAGEVLKDVPGLLVLQPSGQVGSGVKIQLRGLRSLFSGNDPLVYVDGVRTTRSSASLPWVRGESALDFIPPSNIDRIEVFKGPAATARFGTGAMHGVIHIHTKKGPIRKP
jgi:hypothetical protein